MHLDLIFFYITKSVAALVNILPTLSAFSQSSITLPAQFMRSRSGQNALLSQSGGARAVAAAAAAGGGSGGGGLWGSLSGVLFMRAGEAGGAGGRGGGAAAEAAIGALAEVCGMSIIACFLHHQVPRSLSLQLFFCWVLSV